MNGVVELFWSSTKVKAVSSELFVVESCQKFRQSGTCHHSTEKIAGAHNTARTMANVPEIAKKINTKLGFLSYLTAETEEMLERKDPKEIERQQKVYEIKLDEFQDLKVKIQGLKSKEGEDPADIRKWRIDIEHNLKDFLPIFCRGMRDTLESLRNEKRKKQHESELELEKVRCLQ